MESTGTPLPSAHHQQRRIIRAPQKGKANVWPHVHELTEAYHEAHSDVKKQDRKTHVCIECWELLKLHIYSVGTVNTLSNC